MTPINEDDEPLLCINVREGASFDGGFPVSLPKANFKNYGTSFSPSVEGETWL